MDQLKDYLKDTTYKIVDATDCSIHEIQNRLRECRVDDNLVIFVKKCKESTGFFERLKYFKLDTQDSNYYIAHSRNYAVWVNPSELKKSDLLAFLHESKSTVQIDSDFFENYSEYGNQNSRIV